MIESLILIYLYRREEKINEFKFKFKKKHLRVFPLVISTFFSYIFSFLLFLVLNLSGQKLVSKFSIKK